MRRHLLLMIAATMVLAACWAIAAPALAAPEPMTSKVTYVTGISVYVDAGAVEGVAVGDRMEVVDGDAVAAVLKVNFTSEHKSVCSRVSTTRTIAAGDVVRYTPTLKPRAAASSTYSPTDPAPAGVGAPKSQVHGRIGVAYLTLKQTGAGDIKFHQPAADVRLDGRDNFGAPIDFAVDARARRTYRTLADGREQTEGRTRIYRALVAWQPARQAFRLTLGRQFSPSLAAVSVFDGAVAEYRTETWSVGAFGGTQPDPVNYAVSSKIREFGGYFEFGRPTAVERRWSVTTGAVRSTDEGEINRDWLYIQARYDDRKLSAYATQELDYNRGWRRDAEGKTWSSTSSFVSLRYRFVEAFALDAGYDSRRNVRLFRDVNTPVTEFDDQFRRGVWGGVSGRVARIFMYGLSARRSTGNNDATADSYTVTLGVSPLTKLNLDLRERSTHYTNDFVKGWLHSLAVSAPLSQWARLGLYGGLRDDTAQITAVPGGRLTWFGVDFDLTLGRQWFFMMSAERNSGDEEENEQLYTALTFRF